jgi:hypothetical protein
MIGRDVGIIAPTRTVCCIVAVGESAIPDFMSTQPNHNIEPTNQTGRHCAAFFMSNGVIRSANTAEL